jgi:hypothetical protein
VQLAQDRDERVVCRPRGEIVELTLAPAFERGPAASDLEAGGAHEQRVQALSGVFAHAARARQRSQPTQ